MSGHSRWAKLKHFKGALDARKSALFSKLSQLISVAAREGDDEKTNFKLRLAIEKAKKANMPKENIERAIKRGAGKTGETQIEEITYEVFGPEGIAIIIEALTDNRNRTISNLRRLLNRYELHLGEKNSVLRLFEKRGILRMTNFNPPTDGQIKNLEDFELKIIDLGAEDFQEEDHELAIYTKPENLQKVKEGLEREGFKIDYAEIEWFAKHPITIRPETQKTIDAFFAELDEDPDINDYYTNIE
ncbi:MAG: YebC/PmpR family DNA-binding transcriptional regulator [Patescibacteria group bacterium]|nr:YebC/PmpR family DNA-binding transcriptional regulator [Patescibacteria group bacterium]